VSARIEAIAARGLDLILRAVFVGCGVAIVCVTYAIISGAVEELSR